MDSQLSNAVSDALISFLDVFLQFCLQLVQNESKTVPQGHSVQANLTYDLIYMIHCTRVVTDLALIIDGQIMSKSLFVGFGPKMKFVQVDVFDIPSKLICVRKQFASIQTTFIKTLFILHCRSLTLLTHKRNIKFD